MSKSKTFVSLMLVIMLLSFAASTVLAGPPTNTHEIVNEPVTWALPAGTCDAAPSGLEGSGQRHKVINTRVNADGSTVITSNDVVKGSAWDSSGSYNFIYENHTVEEIPANGGAHQIHMEDSFVVNGNGSVGHLAVGFNWRWTFTPPAEMWPPNDNWQQLSTRGDPFHCDPL